MLTDDFILRGNISVELEYMAMTIAVYSTNKLLPMLH